MNTGTSEASLTVVFRVMPADGSFERLVIRPVMTMLSPVKKTSFSRAVERVTSGT